MCNFEALEAIRQQVEQMVRHTGELRNRFIDVEEEFREGNLDRSTISSLNQAVHFMEADAAAFEKLLDGGAA